MPKPRRIFLRGEELLRALSRTSINFPVKWISGQDAFRIPAPQALCIARASQYEGQYKNGRVYTIRAIDLRTPNTFDSRRRDGRPVLQMIPIDKNVTKIWDRYFATHPTP